MARQLPLLALDADRLRSAPVGDFWRIVDPMEVDNGKIETADDRLRKLREWARVGPDKRAVNPANQPAYKDFRVNVPGGRNGFAYYHGEGGLNANMANILAHAVLEISKKRYARYNSMIVDTQEEIDRLGELFGVKESDGPPEKETPDTKRYAALLKRKAALKIVKRESFRRMISVIRSVPGLNEQKLLVIDDADQEQYRELQVLDQAVDPFDPVKQLSLFGEALDDMINNYEGNDQLKNYIYADLISFLYDGNAAMDVYRNYVFMGPSGVGKTTWARLMGRLYKHIGIYMYGKVAETSAPDYVGAFIGWSAPQTKSMLDQNLENIVLIDEAYAISDSGSTGGKGGSYGREVITEMVNYMDKNKGCLMLIIAGYEGKMKTDPDSFLANNEGLDRRFPSQFVFELYTARQMVDILKTSLKRKGLLDKWEEQTFVQLLDLATLLTNHDANRRNPAVADQDQYTSAAVFYDELLSKQGGSIENISNEVVKYMSLPDKNPSRYGRKLYDYEHDMVQILASKLDRKWVNDLNDPNSNVYAVLHYPILKNVPGRVNFSAVTLDEGNAKKKRKGKGDC